MSLGRVVRLPLSLEVSNRLRAAILDGTLAHGEELPTEAELSRTFNVGRSTVREALRVLQSQGLLSGADSVSTARPQVTHDRTAGSAAAALSTALQVGAVPLDDLMALRLLLESETMRRLGVVPPRVRGCLDEMDTAVRAEDVEAFHLLDVEFHVLLAYAGGNRAVGLILEVLRDSIAAHLLSALRATADVGAVLGRLGAEHRGIVAALDAGEGDRAATLVVDHIRCFYVETTSTRQPPQDDDLA